MNKKLLVSITILLGFFYFTDFSYSRFNIGIIGAIKNKGNELSNKVEKKREEILTLNNPPNIPSNPIPANGATDQSVNVDLSWTGGDPDIGDTVTYNIYFGTSTNLSLVSGDQTITTYDPGTLFFSNSYYWKVVAKDNHGVSTSGPVWRFETLISNNPPNIPSNPIPANGATDQLVNVDLSWIGGDPDIGDTVTYDIYFGISTNPPLVYFNQSTTGYGMGSLSYSNIYYWKVIAKDNHGAFTIGPVWRFETPNLWGTAQLIETDNAGNAYRPQVAIDSSGNAIAVWYQWDGTRDNIWSNRYVPGTGWGTARLIETNNAGDAYGPQIAIDSNGNAIVVWYQSDGTRYNIWSNRYEPGTGWGAAQLIETDNAGNAYRSQVAIDSSGNAIAVWYQSDGTRKNIWSNRYEPRTGWGTAQLIENSIESASFPRVAIDSTGNAIVVWKHFYSIRSNRYELETGWGTAQILNKGGKIGSSPQIVIDSGGNAIIVWGQFDGACYNYNIYSNRYVSGVGWGRTRLIETTNGYAKNSQIAIDSNGNAIAVWYQWDEIRDNIWANRYVPGTGWGTAQLIEGDNTGTAYNPQVAIDSSGNAIAVWYHHDGTRYNIRSNRYILGRGWGRNQLIETDNAGTAYNPQVAIDSSGNAIAVWYQWDGVRYNIWSNRYE